MKCVVVGMGMVTTQRVYCNLLLKLVRSKPSPIIFLTLSITPGSLSMFIPLYSPVVGVAAPSGPVYVPHPHGFLVILFAFVLSCLCVCVFLLHLSMTVPFFF